MDPLLILLSGIVVVVGGIIFFKLHPFLALLIAALTVAILTPWAEKFAEAHKVVEIRSEIKLVEAYLKSLKAYV
jgi:H+/gluconate symporter-like permease